MTIDRGIGVAGILIGFGIAFWQWHIAKAQGSRLSAFLLGLKACDLPPAAVVQIDDMLEWLQR